MSDGKRPNYNENISIFSSNIIGHDTEESARSVNPADWTTGFEMIPEVVKQRGESPYFAGKKRAALIMVQCGCLISF